MAPSPQAGDMSTAMTYQFQIHALSERALAQVRATGVDATGRAAEHRVAEGGEPLRCCLRDAKRGERLVLFAHALDLPDSPYRETGPVFAHAESCAGPVSTTAYPQDWYGRPQVIDRKSTRLNSSHPSISYAVFCLKKKKTS